jgi:hypothetical protein
LLNSRFALAEVKTCTLDIPAGNGASQ